jgi:phosphoribosyl 1,2-cyclic phosphodiesterase
MKVTFWGTRGSIAVPGEDTTLYGGNTTCLEVDLQGGRKVIIDAGTGIRALGEELVATERPIDIHLLITHIHWDHILGFPFFAPIHEPSSRILIDGFHTCMKGLRYTFDNKMGDGFFPIQFDDLKAEIRYLDRLGKGSLEIDGTRIDCLPLQHPQGGFGFRFREGKRSLVFVTDNELRADARAGSTPAEVAAFCKDADILIHDAQYTPQEVQHRRGWGHSDYRATLDLAFRSGVKRLILFHHDPSRTDPEVTAMTEVCRELARRQKSDVRIEAAREGSSVNL